MSVGAVIVTYQRCDVVLQTLAAVRGQQSPPDATVVVDNDDNRAFQQVLKNQFPTVHYLAVPGNPGYGAALAIGMQWLRSTLNPNWYWLLDDDSPPAPDELSQSLDVGTCTPDAAVVATRGGHMRFGIIRHDLQNVSLLSDADFTLVDGSIIKREAVELVGFPRQDLFMMCEDLDYTSRIAEAGGRLVVRPASSSAMHLGSGAAWRSYYQARNHLRISLERRSLKWTVGWCYRMVGLSIADVRRRRWGRLRLRWAGTRDGLLGRMGRRVLK